MKKVKVISKKGLTKDLMNKFSILKEAKCFWQEYLKSVWYSYQLENNTLNVLVALLGLIHGNLME